MLHGFVPGSGGAQPGGIFAINNDGGIVAPGIGRAIPACTTATAGFTSGPNVVPNGTGFVAVVSDFNVGTFSALGMSVGSSYLVGVPGVMGRVLLEPTSTVTIGFGSTPVGFAILVPANPALAGMQLTLQGTLFNPGGSPFAVMATPLFVSIR
jgi:hypothetical protein